MMGDDGIGCVWQGTVGDSRVRAGWQVVVRHGDSWGCSWVYSLKSPAG